jgi:hypothetical protein
VKKTVLLLALLALGLITVYFKQRPSPDDLGPLTLHLRCGADEASVAGRLSVNAGSAGEAQVYQLKTACAVGKIEFKEFRAGDSLRVRLLRDAVAPPDLQVNIDRDRAGFHAIVRITAAPPYLANEAL